MAESFLSNVVTTSIVVVVFAIITVGLYYLMNRRRIQAQKEHFKQLHLEMAPGQMVEFANGLIGKIVSVSEEYCDIEVKSGAIITVSRYAITRRVEA